MRKFTVLLALLIFIGMQAVNAQREISGTVTSAGDGQPVPGATVVVKNTTIGTTTNVDGFFQLSVPEDTRVIVFSYVGMVSQEVELGASNVINSIMESDIMDIEGVVVTALGITREKKALGYSVQDIRGDDLEAAKENNIINSLTGKVAGVQVTSASGAIGASSRIVIRGNSSFGNNQPLFVVDGVPITNYSSDVSQWGGQDFGNAAMDLDPANIETVSVLKGANAAALYGSRAANGVVLITTKKGKTGVSKGIGVTYNMGIGLQNVAYTPLYQDKYGQGYGGSEYDAKAAGIDPSNIAEYEAWSRENSFSYYDGAWGGVMDGIDESWGSRLDIGMNIPQFDSPLTDPNDPDTRTATPFVSNPSNVKDFFQTGHTFDNNLSFVGGSEKASARLGLGYQNSVGTIPNTDLKKYSVNFNGNMELSKRWTAGVTATYVQNRSDNLPGGGYDENNIMQSIGSWFGRQVNMKSLEDNWETLDVFGNPYNWNRSYHNNPYWTVNKNTTSRIRNRVFGNVNLTWKITDYLRVMGRVGTDYFNETRKHVVADMSLESSHGGSFWQTDRRVQETNADLIFSYDQDVSEDWTVMANLGANYRNYTYNYGRVAAAELTVPDLFTIGNAQGNPSVSQYRSEKETNSIFGSVGIGWKRMLYLDVTGRNDWSSTLPSTAWSYFYPSVSLSWIFTESFDISPNVLTFGKIRGSYAVVGNDTDPYQINPTFGVSASPIYGVAQYFYARELPPLELIPEKSYSTEFGFDLKFLNNRIGVDYTYYSVRTENQIMAVDISNASGFNSMRLNAGEIKNWGSELMMIFKVLKSTNGLNWDITLNWAKNNNQVVELYGDLEALTIATSWGSVAVQAIPGEAYGVLKGNGYVRTDGKITVGENGLPLKTPDPIILGNVVPDWTGGIRNTFRWKTWSLSFLFDGRKGGDIYSVTDWFGGYAGVTEETARDDIRENGFIVEDAVYADGSPNQTVVSATSYYENYWGLQEPSIIDGSFIKFRELVFGYEFPRELITRSGFITGCNISFYGRNLALVWRHKSNDVRIDPETGFGAGNAGMGLEQYQIPPVRELGLRFRFNF